MKKMLALAAFALALSTSALVTPVLAAPPPVPQPKILVIDRTAILQFSKVGQDITRQIQAYGEQAKRDLAGQAQSLQKEGTALQQQVAILNADQKAAKIRSFQERQASLQGAAQKKEAMIQGGFMNARTTVEKALGPILQQLIQQRGANLVIDKQAVVFATNNGFDITVDAITLLNQKLPSLKVTLANPPQGTPQR